MPGWGAALRRRAAEEVILGGMVVAVALERAPLRGRRLEGVDVVHFDAQLPVYYGLILDGSSRWEPRGAAPERQRLVMQ